MAGLFRGLWRRGIPLAYELDTWRLYLLVKYRKEVLVHGHRPTEDDFDRLTKTRPPFQEQLEFVQAELQEQVSCILQSLTSSQGCGRGLGFELQERTLRGEKGCPPGVQMRGNARTGDIVAFFPGVVYDERDIWHLPGGCRALEGHNMILRHDKKIVDASSVHLLSPMSGANPLACAQFVRHPPRGHEPNTFPWGMEVVAGSLPPGSEHLVPNAPYSEVVDAGHSAQRRDALAGNFVDALLGDAPQTRNTIPTQVFVALRDIENEELFVDFRLNPAVKDTPPWYEPCGDMASQVRWT